MFLVFLCGNTEKTTKFWKDSNFLKLIVESLVPFKVQCIALVDVDIVIVLGTNQPFLFKYSRSANLVTYEFLFVFRWQFDFVLEYILLTKS